MREVNNNTTSKINFQNVQPAAKEDAVPVKAAETKEVTDLGKMPAEVIGRSQVSKSNLEKDLALYLSNPKVVETSMDFFDRMEQMGYTPEESAAMMGKFAEEFSV